MHLTASSPAIGAGIILPNDLCGTLDIDGQPRTVGGAIDIGADEFISTLAGFVKPHVMAGTPSVRLEKVSPSKWLLRYALSGPASVAYSVFSLNGSLLFSSNVGYQPAGDHSVPIDFGSGAGKVYCIRVKLGNAVESCAVISIRFP